MIWCTVGGIQEILRANNAPGIDDKKRLTNEDRLQFSYNCSVIYMY